MKRFLWMLLIFIFIFSLTALLAEDSNSKKVEKTEKIAVEKVGKKVSEMPKVQVGQKSAEIKISQVKKANSSNEKKVYRKPYVEKKNTVNNKTVKSKKVNVKATD